MNPRSPLDIVLVTITTAAWVRVVVAVLPFIH
jgi:hypothetical protein